MADPILIGKSCERCGGDGLFPNMETDPVTGQLYQPEPTVTCDCCDGNGYTIIGFLPASFQEQIDGIQDKVNDTLDKCNDIFEKVTAIDANVKSNIETCEKILKLVEK